MQQMKCIISIYCISILYTRNNRYVVDFPPLKTYTKRHNNDSLVKKINLIENNKYLTSNSFQS